MTTTLPLSLFELNIWISGCFVDRPYLNPHLTKSVLDRKGKDLSSSFPQAGSIQTVIAQASNHPTAISPKIFNAVPPHNYTISLQPANLNFYRNKVYHHSRASQQQKEKRSKLIQHTKSYPTITMANKQPNLFAFPTIPALAQTLRTYIINAQSAGITRHNSFKIAVSGGSLPKTLAQALLAASNGPDDVVQFSKWEIFFADERAVPLDHEDSNYALLKSELLDKIPQELGKPVVHPIDVKYLDDVQELADQYEQLLVRSFASRYLPHFSSPL